MTALTITGVRSIPLELPTLIAAAEIAAPMDRHAAYRHRRTSWYGSMSPVLVLIETSDGLTGIGMTHGGRATAAGIGSSSGSSNSLRGWI